MMRLFVRNAVGMVRVKNDVGRMNKRGVCVSECVRVSVSECVRVSVMRGARAINNKQQPQNKKGWKVRQVVGAESGSHKHVSCMCAKHTRQHAQTRLSHGVLTVAFALRFP